MINDACAHAMPWLNASLTPRVQLASFKAPFITIAYGLGIAPEGTTEPNPLPPYVCNHHLNT